MIDKYDLDDLRNTIAPVVNARTGIVISQHWLALVGYGFIRREDYDYRLNYFTGNQKVYEQRDIHNLHVQSGYFFFPYQNRYNISIEVGLGWALYRSTLNAIDNYSASSSSGLRRRNQVVTFQSHEFYLTPTVKLYRNLRKGLGLGGDIYIGLQYPMLFPSRINFPEILLGFDASIDFSYNTDRKKKTFISEKEVKKTEEFEQELKEDPKKIEEVKKEVLNDIEK